MTHPANLTNPDDIRQFIVAGKAKFTLVSLKTGKRFTYKVNKKQTEGPVMYFVSVLDGPDNWTNYRYIGHMRGYERCLIAGRKGLPNAPSFKALYWFIEHLFGGNEQALDQVEFWHEGACAACGRLLTVPASIATGFGPHCATKHGVEMVDEQTALGKLDGQALLYADGDDPRLHQAEHDAEMAGVYAAEVNDEHRAEMEREDALYGNPYDADDPAYHGGTNLNTDAGDERLRNWIKEQVG